MNITITICGTKKVGKTSAWFMWLFGRVLEKCPFDNSDTLIKTIYLDGVNFNVEWNEMHDDDVEAMQDLYLRNADVVVVMVSMTDAASYDFAKGLKERTLKIKQEFPKPNSKDLPVPFILWENKTDLESDRRVVSMDRAEELAAEFGMMLVRASARNKEQSEQVFNRTLRLYTEELQKSTNTTDPHKRKCAVM